MIVTSEAVLLSDLAAEEIPPARPLFIQKSEDQAWLAPLRGAVMCSLLLDDWLRLGESGIDVVTSWHSSLRKPGDSDTSEKHKLYAEYMLEVIGQEMPGLIWLLKGAGAMLYVSPGACGYCLPGGTTINPIPDLLHFTELLPWKTVQDEEWAQ